MAMPLPPGKQLAVPPMHPDLDPDIREQILDYVNRRMFVEAFNLAEEAEYERKRGHQTPNAHARAEYRLPPVTGPKRPNSASPEPELRAYDQDDLAEFVDAVVGPAAEDFRNQHIGKGLMDRVRTLAKDPSPRAKLGVDNNRSRRYKIPA